MSCNTKQFGKKLKLYSAVVGFMLFSNAISANTRVLVRFDETGHYAHRVHRSASPEAVDEPLSLPTTSSEVSLRWFDGDGVLLASTRIIDPRVTHAPLEIGSTELAWTVLLEGAYLASGPSAAVQLLIILPEREVPAVAAESWTLDLN